MAINKFQRLTIDLSAKVAHIGVPSCSGHVTKMADMPIYGSSFREPEAHDLRTWYVAYRMWGLLSSFKL